MRRNEHIGTVDWLIITLDTLRYDVAVQEWRAGRTPNLAAVLPATGWEHRHTPGSFTFAAHAAMFAGFFPTLAAPGKHPRSLALRFPGSETTTAETVVLDAPDVIHGFAARGYRTICIGGVGFFNKQTPLGKVLPSYFDESHWAPTLGVTEPRSTEYQVALALERIDALAPTQRVLLFMNVSAIHQPNYFYLPGSTTDTLDTHAAALRYVDGELGHLWAGLRARRSWNGVICSDHGTAYGEAGYTGHRLAHPVVWDVPYAEFTLHGEGT